MLKKILIGFGIFIVIAAFGAALEDDGSDNASTAAPSSSETIGSEEAPTPLPPPEPEPEPEPVAPEVNEPSLTSGQQNALRTAQEYLNFSAFSAPGLVDQLEFEGYTTEDAMFAVNALDVDWNEQAAKAAESYLDFSGFSRSGLIEQLEFEGYTREQAEYGVTQAGL